ncbi:hypothetical protein QWY77_04705 [Thalassotalea ponticola]|uniref:hypothetical protein n=1 Tax=Thalassotalea ponticola TaxID=1523392 RepID=UPI0025B3ABD5|nr:hypothetical protein [Thalassotalea ponticola]MDN3652066.1 hypothetical protein [Thalassotalea ponticola]
MLLILVICHSNAHAAEVGLGLHRYMPLNQGVDFDGVHLAGKYQLTKQWHVVVEFEFLQEQFDQSEFTIMRQVWGGSYQLAFVKPLLLTLTLGGHHVQREFNSDTFSNNEHDFSYLVGLDLQHTIVNDHDIGTRLRHYQLFDNPRYDLALYYQHHLSRLWRFEVLTELAYDRQLEHDANRYQVTITYVF